MSTPISKTPGTLPYVCYPELPQTLNVDIVNLMTIFLNENFPGIYLGTVEPPADQRDRIWFYGSSITTVTKWYLYINGAWQRSYDVVANSGENKIIRIPVDDYNTEQGGDASSVAVGPSVGPLWIKDDSMDGSVPIGIGLIPGSSPAASITAIGDVKDTLGNTGEYKHVLTGLEGANDIHTHGMGVCDPASDDGVFRIQGSSTVPNYLGHYIVGGGSQNNPTETTANLFTLPSGNDGKGVSPSAGHSSMQPWVGRIFVKRTARIYVPPPY